MSLGLAFFFVCLAIVGAFALGVWHRNRRLGRGQHPGVFHDLWQNLGRSLWGGPLVLHLVAIVATVAFVSGGADRAVQDFFQAHDPLGFGIPYVILAIGNFWHVLAGTALWAMGRARRSLELVGVGLAAVQAVALSGWMVTLEKVLTGRRGPQRGPGAHWFGSPFVRSEDAADFRFDFWNHAFVDGRFFWPSGHTASIVAFASAVVAFYPERRGLAVGLYALSLLTGLAMIDGDFHWFSDVVAGALIGHGVGWTVGVSFRRRYRTGVETGALGDPARAPLG